MKKRFITLIRKNIIQQYPNYSTNKIDTIMYGVESIYLLITKTIIIFTFAFFFGILKEMIVLLITFNVIRTVAFGLHANKSWVCLLFSSTIFITATYLCKYLTIPTTVLYILYIIAIIFMLTFAPADTIKRPIIKKKKRNIFKIVSILVVICYFIISLLIENNLVKNALILGLLIEIILINPVTYKMFKLPYNNYKKYSFKHANV
ncbi:MAG: accessory gene regulator B family protein [Bacilli bacterium]